MDIAAHHVIIMATLKNFGRATCSEVGEATYISKAQMTHSTSKLIRMGLIESHHDIRDRRRTNLQLTEKGHHTVDRMHRIIVGLLKERLSSLSPDEVENLGRSMEEAANLFMKLK